MSGVEDKKAGAAVPQGPPTAGANQNRGALSPSITGQQEPARKKKKERMQDNVVAAFPIGRVVERYSHQYANGKRPRTAAPSKCS